MSTYTLVKIEELNGGTPATIVNDADLVIIKQGGVDKFIPFGTFKTQMPNYAYISGTFDNTDLSAFVLTINHAKNTRLVRLTILNPAGEYQSLPYYIIDSNNIAVNFGGDIESGDWEYLLEYWGGAAAAYPDPTYALAAHNHIDTVPTLNSSGRDAKLTVTGSSFRKYGNIVTGYIIIKTTTTSDSSYLQVGIMSVAPTIPGYFVGNTENTGYYEGATGYIEATSGIMYIRLHVPNQNYICPITYFSV